jgi:hypothetical protein
MILPNRTSERKLIAAGRFYAPINTARDTWWDRAEREKSAPARITWGFDA